MTEAKRQQLKEKIAAAEARNEQKAGSIMDRAGERAIEAKDRFTAFAKEHPVSVVAGGIAAGILVSALFKRSPTRKMAKKAGGKASALTALGMELASAYARHAMDAAAEARNAGAEKLDEFGNAVGKTTRSWGRSARHLVADVEDTAVSKKRDTAGAIRRALRSRLN